MIDFLSSSEWINPQIDFLLFLQNIRINCTDIIDKLFLSITIFGEFWLPTLISAIVYWCIDFRAGVYLFSLEGLNVILAHLLKMIACVYRPWILSDKIHPSELAIPFAKGYSCPSGHSAMSSSVLGGVAYYWRKNKILCISLIFLILLIGFSRMWLGVHTPQDVFFGLSMGLILIFAVNKIINWAENESNRYLYLALTINLFAVLALVYIYFFNTYRIDYIDGVLLVNPQKSIFVMVVVYSFVLGLMNGCFLCRKFYPFNPKESHVKNRIIRGLIGGAIVITLLKLVVSHIIVNGARLSFAVPVVFIIGIFVTLIYPIIFTKIEKLTSAK